MTISFRCGHAMSVPDSISAAPRCGICGETVVARVVTRPPCFRGVARGPHAVYEPLPALPVDLTVPKEHTHG